MVVNWVVEALLLLAPSAYSKELFTHVAGKSRVRLAAPSPHQIREVLRLRVHHGASEQQDGGEGHHGDDLCVVKRVFVVGRR
jgi:hypothetical protein